VGSFKDIWVHFAVLYEHAHRRALFELHRISPPPSPHTNLHPSFRPPYLSLSSCQVDFAMESLKKSMKWDEDVFGLEYDLVRAAPHSRAPNHVGTEPGQMGDRQGAP
jgi:hypothetical protein